MDLLHPLAIAAAHFDPHRARWRWLHDEVVGFAHRYPLSKSRTRCRLTPLVYEQLRRLAGSYMRKERAGHQLQTTALVHEAYLRLVQAEDVDWRDRIHFFAVSARVMRRILVDAARRRASAKRGGRMARDDHSAIVDLDSLPAADDRRAAELCAIDDALTALAQLDQRRAQVVELRFFGGLSVAETAEALKVSPETVMRDWKLARAWLNRELRKG